jgi:hypothetical protein
VPVAAGRPGARRAGRAAVQAGHQSGAHVLSRIARKTRLGRTIETQRQVGCVLARTRGQRRHAGYSMQMTSCQTAAVVACRVLGLYIAIRWLGLLPAGAFELTTRPSYLQSLLSLAALLLVPVALAVVLWTLAPWIARHMLANVESQPASPSTITMEEAQIVAISILGLFFVVGAIPGLVVAIVDYFGVPEMVLDATMKSAMASMQSVMRAGTLKALAVRVTEMGLGTWLFFGAGSFVRVFQRFNPPQAG